MNSIIDSLAGIGRALLPYLGLLITALLTMVLILVTRRIGRKKQISPYSRQVITGAMVLLGFFIAVLVLPVSSEARGQILSLLGILVSAVIALSSTNLMGNAMAGIMLRLSRSFRPGDFIEVEQTRGRVFQQGLFTTQIQIITRDVINLPNLYLIQNSLRVVNKEGSFISAPVSLGYDCHHLTVEEALKHAAQSCGLKESFVYVEELLDHAVVYRVYGFLEDYTRILTAKSELKKAMLDSLHNRGIEIVSPSFVIRRLQEEHIRILSQDASRKEKTVESPQKKEESIEEKTFDKAEEAADLEELKEDYQELDKNIEALKEKKKQADSPDERQKIDEKLKTKSKQQSLLQERIDARQDEQSRQ